MPQSIIHGRNYGTGRRKCAVARVFLKAGEGKIVSRYDAAFAVDDPYPESRSARGPDPIRDAV